MQVVAEEEVTQEDFKVEVSKEVAAAVASRDVARIMQLPVAHQAVVVVADLSHQEETAVVSGTCPR